MKNFLLELEMLATETARAILPTLLGAYVNKVAGSPGAMPITLGNVGRVAGLTVAQVLSDHLAHASAQASMSTESAPGPVAVSVAVASGAAA